MPKQCRRCGGLKEANEFNRDPSRKDGLSSLCQPCARAVVAEWRKKYPERARESKKKWERNNPDKARKSRARRAARLKEWKRAYYAVWDKVNAHKRASYLTKYRKAHPEKYSAQTAKRLAQKRRAMPVWATANKIAWFYAEARRLSESTGIKHHVDHIVPLISKAVCGLHVEHNLQVVPGSVNTQKQNRFWPDMPTESANA